MTATTTETALNPSFVKTTLNYYLDPSQGGHTEYQIGVVDYFRRKFDTHDAIIENIRGREDEFKLDVNGFQHVRADTVEKDFDDNERIKRVVYPETEELIKKITGATRVHTFSHITRKESREEAEKAVREDPNLKDGNVPYQKVTPARFIHVDFSTYGSHEILKDNFDTDLGEKLMQTRWGIINCWRPIKPVSKDPLGFCDAKTARDEDMMPVVSYLPPKGSGQYADVSGGQRFELYYKRYHEGEKWYYADKMMPGECLLLKIYDSIEDGKTAKRVAHSAFQKPGTDGENTRESIEIRCLVFWENQPNA